MTRHTPGVTAGWKHYAGKTGWRFIARHKGRNIAYFKPANGWFVVSLALSEKGLGAAGSCLKDSDQGSFLIEHCRFGSDSYFVD